jgi:hypothetical protein
VDYIVLGDFKKNGLIVSLVGTGIKIWNALIFY